MTYKSQRLSNAERQARFVKRMRKKGYKKISVWVRNKPQNIRSLKAYAKGLNELEF